MDDLGALVGTGIKRPDAVDTKGVKDRAISHDLAVAGQAMDGGPINFDCAGIDDMPIRAQLRRQAGGSEISRLPADEENVACDGAIRMFTPDRVNHLQT